MCRVGADFNRCRVDVEIEAHQAQPAVAETDAAGAAGVDRDLAAILIVGQHLVDRVAVAVGIDTVALAVLMPA